MPSWLVWVQAAVSIGSAILHLFSANSAQNAASSAAKVADAVAKK